MDSTSRVPLDDKPLLEFDKGVMLPVYRLDQDGSPSEERRRSRKRKFAKRVHILVLMGVLYSLIKFLALPAAVKLFRTCYKDKQAQLATTEWPIPPDVNVVECHDWSDSGLYDELSTFELPVSSKALFFLSRGWPSGIIKVVPSDHDSKDVTVNVLTKYSHPELLEFTRVCKIARGEGETGVGIFTDPGYKHPRHPRKHRHLSFEVTIHLPKSKDLDSLYDIELFETDMPLFYHTIENLATVAHFKSISLKTLHTPIAVGSISADHGSFTTLNSPIKGSFNTSSSLLLSTSNSPIEVHVGMLNSKKDDFTTLSMDTSNAPLSAVISLSSAESTGGSFKVTSTNSVGTLDIAFDAAPVNSTLILDAETSVSPANVKLHKTFEGKFFLETSLTRPRLAIKEVDDPSGKGRKRIINSRSVAGSQIEGTVGWSEEGAEVGDVYVQTSISPLTLYI